ncbi:MAG: TauD/TfdA family dioxygenase [Pseudomonadales bacterium]|nr:TauD/TfdA family dioxygenase [Pseudomonadales bacterium]
MKSQTVLSELFDSTVTIEPLSHEEGMGRRIRGVDLSTPLTPKQAKMVVQLLDDHNILTFPGQDLTPFELQDMERFANYFGAPIPHPKNYANYGASPEKLVLLPIEERTSSRSNQAFPGRIRCVAGADSPAVYIVTNLNGSGPQEQEETTGGQHWHTDIEFEPVPLSTSLFYVQCAPVTRKANGSWVTNPPRPQGFYHPDSAAELSELREALPLNGETAYANTAAAYSALSNSQRAELDSVMVRRRFRVGDSGWLAPLVYTNPRNGKKSLHSPVWASRGKNVAPVEVQGKTPKESREFLDRLEAHVLQPQFRYDHAHCPGDVTVWSNFATLHTAPPSKRIINNADDARLMYRISCKGLPTETLPRNDSDEWINENIQPPYRSPVF